MLNNIAAFVLRRIIYTFTCVKTEPSRTAMKQHKICKNFKVLLRKYNVPERFVLTSASGLKDYDSQIHFMVKLRQRLRDKIPLLYGGHGCMKRALVEKYETR